ncbi:unnamed protein product [Chrysoparadoxa australica]
MQVKLLFFASCRDLTECKEGKLELPGDHSSTNILREQVVHSYPSLKSVAATITLAVNHEYVAEGEDKKLKDSDEVAFIPPISGG